MLAFKNFCKVIGRQDCKNNFTPNIALYESQNIIELRQVENSFDKNSEII